MRTRFALLCLVLFLAPLTGSISQQEQSDSKWSSTIPAMTPVVHQEIDWWDYTTMDSNRNAIHDSLETMQGPVGVGLSYGRDVNVLDTQLLESLGYEIRDVIEAVDVVLLGIIDSSNIWNLSQIDGVVMVERYGQIILYGDVQTPNIKSEPSADYPHAAWNHTPMLGAGVNIAMVDTGVDNEHPGLNQKFIAGYDAVCFMHTDPECALAGGRETDGSFDPDDGNQHGTACMGMASATGLDSNGEQTGFEGSAPNASLIDVRIGTDAGAGPFENYLLSQEFYESAMNGLQWIIDNKDTAWPGVDESLYGIDIISLSWGITSHENGGSDGEDMHSRILNEATLAGIAVSVAAGNDGPDNDGFSGMGSSSLSITVGATDDMNTVNRSDDGIASYSSRGPRRDNGDGDPLNEMKPDVSAPGTNIIQAEACITAGGCNNFLGGDASTNGYTGRGSGTSYATPAVSGVIALMLEVNPDMDPLLAREILRQTATRMGPASQPDIDPHWNKDFGWGLVDAHDAVDLAAQLTENQLNYTDMNLDLQVHYENATVEMNGNSWTTTIEGIAWTRGLAMERIEWSTDGITWTEAEYEVVEENLTQYQTFDWRIVIESGELPEGFNEIMIRGVDAEGMYSLPDIVWVEGTGYSVSGMATSWGYIMYISIVGVAVASVGVWVFIRQSTEEPFAMTYKLGAVPDIPLPVDGTIIEAELID